jgi:hypothetical protein
VNINMLRDTDDNPGFYAAAGSADSKWPGCVLFQSIDNGATYQQIDTFGVAATMGRTLDALGDFAGGNIPDEINTIRVSMIRGTLSSVSYPAFINGVQTAVVGDEIVHFRSAVLNVDGTYTVSGFLRGRRGSEYATSSHASGERFVLVDTSIHRIPGVTADLHVPRLYKAVTVGGSLAKTAARSFTNEGAGLKPYAPVLVGGGRDADGNLTINWTRRTRISGEWRNSVNAPLGETSEAYEVDILDGTTVVRTLTSSTPTVVYTATDQTTDFGSPQSSVSVSVFMISSTVGRGYAASATI